MTLGQFYHMLRGNVRLRIGGSREFVPAFSFYNAYAFEPVWLSRIDVIRGEVVDGVCCFTVFLCAAEEVPA